MHARIQIIFPGGGGSECGDVACTGLVEKNIYINEK